MSEERKARAERRVAVEVAWFYFHMWCVVFFFSLHLYIYIYIVWFSWPFGTLSTLMQQKPRYTFPSRTFSEPLAPLSLWKVIWCQMMNAQNQQFTTLIRSSRNARARQTKAFWKWSSWETRSRITSWFEPLMMIHLPMSHPGCLSQRPEPSWLIFWGVFNFFFWWCVFHVFMDVHVSFFYSAKLSSAKDLLNQDNNLAAHTFIFLRRPEHSVFSRSWTNATHAYKCHTDCHTNAIHCHTYMFLLFF